MDAVGFNPSLHPRDLVGRWAHVASGDQAAKKLATATKPRTSGGVKVNASVAGPPPLELPDLPVDRVPLRLQREVKAVIKEIEATGRTNDNSRVRRVLNSANSIGDNLFAARNANGDIIGAALVDITGGKRSRSYRVHELFKDKDAPPKTGSLLMVEIAKAAKADNAELTVTGAVGSARTFYEQMGGDFRGVRQPSGIFTSQSTHCTWTNEARDALAEGRPIPAQHYLVEGPMQKIDDRWTNTWVEP